jgi:mRNA interferase MazF
MIIRLKRGDVVVVDLEPVRGSEQQGKERPCVIVQNDIANMNSSVTTVVPLTNAKNIKKKYPVIVFVGKGESGLDVDSAALCNQIRTVDKKQRIIKIIGHISDKNMSEIDDALKIHLNL